LAIIVTAKVKGFIRAIPASDFGCDFARPGLRKFNVTHILYGRTAKLMRVTKRIVSRMFDVAIKLLYRA
jgi:hypothetical protein